jgi:ribosomal protein S18 acetylase RimI-like enzyme
MEGCKMKQSVQYRAFKKEDVKALVRVIIESWDYDKIFSKKVARHFAHLFLYSELSRKTFARVAEVDGEALGVIIADVKGKDKQFKDRFYFLKAVWHAFQLCLSKEGRSLLKHQGYGTMVNNKEMLNSLNESFDTEVALFAVSPRAQGLGIGSNLFKYFLDQMKEKRIEKFFLYTDTTCNFGFYEHKGLKRQTAVERYIPQPVDKTIEYYIYKGTVS